MNGDDFWEQRLAAIKSKLTMNIIAFCDVYDILHAEVFNSNNVKAELSELINKAVEMFITDNYE